MKTIFQEFYCSVCGQISILKVENICLNCRDNQILNEIYQEESN
ncbi:MAG: hypothetical protein ACFFBY_02645 [Promethearchaeota archaeon]